MSTPSDGSELEEKSDDKSESAGPDQVPQFFGIEVTRRCNLRCPHCFTRSGGSHEHPGPDLDTLKTLFSNLYRVGVRRIAFSGGEPLLRKDLEELMMYGLQLGIESYGIVTNGFLATRQRAKDLVRCGLRIAQVSIDGVDAIDHCAIRNCLRRDFYRGLRAIRFFQDAGIPVDVATLLSPRNAERAPEMALFCEVLRVRGLRYCSFVPTGRAVTEDIVRRYTPTAAQVDEFVQFMQNMAGHAKAPLQIFIDHGIGPWHPTGKFKCDAGDGIAYCSCEGLLYPCPGLIFDKFIVGNIFTDSIEKLFAAKEMARVRCIKKREINGICADCTNEDCSGGCRGAAFAMTGSEYSEPAYCFFRKRS